MTGSKTALTVAVMLGLALSAGAQAPTPTRPINAVPPEVTFSFGDGIVTGPHGELIFRDDLLNYGGELTLTADELSGNPKRQFQATGDVRVHDADTTLRASSLKVDGRQQHAVADRAELTKRPFLVHAMQIDMAPTDITAYEGTFTTAPPGTRPDLEARVATLTLHPDRHNGIMHGASIYLLHVHVVTVRRISFTYGRGSQSTQRSAVLPVVGVSSRYGPYLAFGKSTTGNLGFQYRILLPSRQAPQITLASSQPLLHHAHTDEEATPAPVSETHDYLGAIRTFSTVPAQPLPEGDPLFFHNYLPRSLTINPLQGNPSAALSVSEELATHVESSGNLKTNLYVSRLPEVSLNASLPLTRVPAAPISGDPNSFRNYRKRFVLVANAQVSYGYFIEQPNDLHSGRQRDSVGLTTSPLLIAPNTLLQPKIELTKNFYTGYAHSYQFAQAGAEVDHYLTSYNVIGVQFLAASTSGQSPFNFDVLDTSRELDARLQVGNRRFAVASQVRFDLDRGGIIDYKLAIAPGLNGVTPVFSYNFENRSIGLGADIPGLTF